MTETGIDQKSCLCNEAESLRREKNLAWSSQLLELERANIANRLRSFDLHRQQAGLLLPAYLGAASFLTKVGVDLKVHETEYGPFGYVAAAVLGCIAVVALLKVVRPKSVPLNFELGTYVKLLETDMKAKQSRGLADLHIALLKGAQESKTDLDQSAKAQSQSLLVGIASLASSIGLLVLLALLS